MKILIDIGHNCYPDIGASAIGDENKMNMEVGTKVIAKLKALGHTVVNVTPASATSVMDSLAQRVNKANSEGGDIYVAIHFNCGGGHGVEIWSGSQTSSSIAQKVLDQIVALGFTNRGVKIQGQNGYERLYVLNNTSMPAILTEGCFVDSADDMNRYNTESIANAIVKGITGQSVITKNDNKTYRVITGSFSSKQDAVNFADKLKSQGTTAYVVDASILK